MRTDRPSSSLGVREGALLRVPEDLGSVELVALVLSGARSPKREPAARLLDELGGLAALGRLGAAELGRAGLGRLAALRLAAGVELGRRVLAEQSSQRLEPMTSFDAVVSWARPRLAALDHEEVWLLGLDGRNGLRSTRRVARGGAHGCALTPRDLLAPALRDGSSAIVLVHNHPSGDPTPSPEDLAMTDAVARACEVVGIPLLDHVVVARSGARSVCDAAADR